jgi:hypothetical protein
MKITDTQQYKAFVRPRTRPTADHPQGRDAEVQPGSVLWSGPPFVAITPAEDGLSAIIVAVGVGSGEISVSADADLGDGVVTISGSEQIVVVPSQAASLAIEDTDVQEQVEPGPEPNPAPEPTPTPASEFPKVLSNPSDSAQPNRTVNNADEEAAARAEGFTIVVQSGS